MRSTENCVRDLPLVESTPAILRDQPQCLREIGIAEDLSQLRGLAMGQKYAAALGIAFYPIWRGFPVGMDNFGNWIPLLGIKDGGLEQFFPRQSSETLVQYVPPCHGSGHSDGVDDGIQHRNRSLGFQVFNGQALRRPSAGI